MKTKRFVHVGFNFEDTTPPIKQLEATFDKAKDWIRYGNQCWILYTALDLDEWRDRIRRTKGLKDTVSFLVVEFDYHSGYMSDFEWKWLQKDRS